MYINFINDFLIKLGFSSLEVVEETSDGTEENYSIESLDIQDLIVSVRDSIYMSKVYDISTKSIKLLLRVYNDKWEWIMVEFGKLDKRVYVVVTLVSIDYCSPQGKVYNVPNIETYNKLLALYGGENKDDNNNK